jgi:hypothetical protein
MKQKQGDDVFTHMIRTAGSHTGEMRLKDKDPTLFQRVHTDNAKLTEAEEVRNVLDVLRAEGVRLSIERRVL